MSSARDAHESARYQTLVEKRSQITPGTRCDKSNCKSTQEFLPLYTMTGLQWCEELRSYRCRQCWDLHHGRSSKGRLRERTQAECDKWRQRLKERRPGERQECENCRVVKGDPGAPKRFTKPDTGCLCILCYVYMNKYKKHQPTRCNEYNEAIER